MTTADDETRVEQDESTTNAAPTPSGSSDPPADRRASRTDDVMAIVVTLATALHLSYYFPRVVDDMFISLRFAENLARGQGAVFNVGERVEGYSGPAWMFLQSLGPLLHVDGVTWTKLLGIGALVLLQRSLFRLTRETFGVEGWLAWMPSLAVACNSYVINWSTLGLETPLHLAALIAAAHYTHRAVKDATRRNLVLAALSLILLGTTRPESMLYLALVVVAPLFAATSRPALVRTTRTVARFAVPAGVVLALMLLGRRAYYGYFVPNTYFVKGTGVTFDLQRLAPLWGQGVGAAEAIVDLAGVVLLVAFGVRRRVLAPALEALACAYFTASVLLDWMPSLRHLLPITVLAPIGWTLLADEASRLSLKSPAQAAAVRFGPGVLLALAAYQVALVDNRNSPAENRNGTWVRPKTWAKFQDTLLAYRRIEPAHVKRMGPYEMGQISQCWGVLETSSAPLEGSWFVGRDIGAVGYFTPVRIYDTAGLFTPSVSHSTEWVERHTVSDALVREMMGLHPLGGEIYEGWELALGRHPELLEGYRLRFGTPEKPYAFIATDRPAPTRDEVLDRYRAMRAKFPRLYHLHTLYGESVGAVIDRRIRIVERGRH